MHDVVDPIKRHNRRKWTNKCDVESIIDALGTAAVGDHGHNLRNVLPLVSYVWIHV